MTAYAPTQDGSTTGGGWIAGDPELLVSEPGVFQAHAGVIFVTSGAEITSGELRLTTAPGSDPGAGALLRVLAVVESAPADYSASLLPDTRGEQLVAEAAFAGGTPGAVTSLALGATPIPGNAATCAATLAALLVLWAAPGWSGRVALTIATDTVESLVLVALEGGAGAPVLEVTEVAAEVTPARSWRPSRGTEPDDGLIGAHERQRERRRRGLPSA